MIITKIPMKDKPGSCNYCNRDTEHYMQLKLGYAYNYIYEIRGNYIVTRCCPECMKELSQFITKTNKEN